MSSLKNKGYDRGQKAEDRYISSAVETLYHLKKDNALKRRCAPVCALIQRILPMSLIGIVSDDMFSPDRLDDVIIVLRSLAIEPRRKKEELAGWAQAVGIGLTKEDYQKLLGIEAERT